MPKACKQIPCNLLPPDFVEFYEEKDLHKPHCFFCVHFATDEGKANRAICFR